VSDARRSKRPIDRLTRLCDAMTDALEAHPEHDDTVRCVIMLSDEQHGGLVTHGYDDTGNDTDAMVDLIMHLKAVFEANGKTLMVMPLGRDG
jgi:hypothetical protein